MPKLSKKERQRIAEIAASPFGIHEALHTAHVLLSAWDDHVRDHPAVSERPDIAALADKATEAMCDVYQAIGRLR